MSKIGGSIKFKGIGRLGVESPRLYFILREIDEIEELANQLEFDESGRLGIDSTRLYGILRKVLPNKKFSSVVSVGKQLSRYESNKLMIMAAYLWNEGRNSLSNEEKEEAQMLLKEFREIGIGE